MATGQTSKLDYLTHHEAGHAAVAFSFGLHLERVWIDQPSARGWTKLTEESLKRRTNLQHVLIALAGGRAEKHLDPSCVGQRTGSDEDEIYALNTIHKRFYDRLIGSPQPYFDKLCKRVNKRLARRCALIVEERWPAIRRLAALLARHASGTRLVELTGEEAEDVLAGDEG
jgi:hypothetical protein